MDSESWRNELHHALEENQDDLIAWLQALVRFDTSNPPGREGPAQAWIAQQFREIGLRVDQWDVFPGRPNVVGVWKGSHNGSSALLNGHIDVAEVLREDLWTTPPFEGKVEGRRLYGRGSSDMKGGLAAFYFAIKSLQDLGVRMRGDVIVESVMGEERNEPGTLACLERGYRADYGIVAEDTGGHRVFANIGAISGSVTIRAPYTQHVSTRIQYLHAGGQLEGANALEKMALKIIPALNELERHWANQYVHHLFPAGQQIINTFFIEGGGNPFITPDSCTLYFTIYYLPTRKKGAVLRQVEDQIHRAAQADLWLRAHPPEIQWKPSRFTLETLPSDIDANHPGTRALMDAHQSVRHEALQLGGLGFASDVGWLYNAGIPSVCYGPGNPDVAHQIDEYVDLDNVIACAEVIGNFLYMWCGPDA